MKNEKSNQLDPMKKWIQEAGTDPIGSEFHLSVLKKIESLPQFNSKYEPVISPLGWKLILVFILTIGAGSLIFMPASKKAPSLFDKLPEMKLPAFNFDWYNFRFPVFELSPPFIFGIVAFFILGFSMIVGTIRNKQAGL